MGERRVSNMNRRQPLLVVVIGLLALAPATAMGVGVHDMGTFERTASDIAVDQSLDAASEQATDVSACRVIDEPGQYELTTDISSNATDTCIVIDANDVTFDGNGHTISRTGDDPDGTAIGQPSGTPDDLENVTVEDVTVTDWAFGVQFYHVRNGSAENVTARDGQWGITIETSTVTVTDSTVRNHSMAGIQTAGTAFGTDFHATLVGNEIVGNEKGVRALMEDDASLDVYRNVFSGNDAGLWMHHASDVTVTQNRFVDNQNGTVVDSTDTQWDDLCEDAPMAEFAIHENAFEDNADYGVYNDGRATVNATRNYWGATDGPSSADDPDAPFSDPETGALADGSGDAVSEGPKAGQSNVHFDDALDAPTAGTPSYNASV